MLLQQQLEKIMRKKKFSKLVSSCQYYCLLGTVHTTSSAGGFDLLKLQTGFATTKAGRMRIENKTGGMTEKSIL